MIFLLTADTEVLSNRPKSKPVQNAINIFKRDQNQILIRQSQHLDSSIMLDVNPKYLSFLEPEQYKLSVPEHDILLIQAPDELGVIYGLLYISNKYLGINPFGFWHDQDYIKKDQVTLTRESYISPVPKVRFRGWFVNDEVLLSNWELAGSNEAVWKIVFETILRCGGNMVIPGTDHNSQKNRQLASDMGLWLTHHHAEPLGAEMFLRAYPDQVPSYVENKELFVQLWKNALIKQQKDKVVWNVGFRGQGDRAFWSDDPRFQTDEERGALISQVIADQCALIEEYIDEPYFCTNLYGEILALYRKGHISIPENVIKIWGDSGYGKMVSRRQGNHNPRTNALADLGDEGQNGIYYHATFYDLQASNHLTMIPNSPEFLVDELQLCFDHGMDQYWIINCGNVKPHTYILDLISQLWNHGELSPQNHLEDFIGTYFPDEKIVESIAQLYNQYFDCIIHYGVPSDERAGEQFYHHPARQLITEWVKGETEKTVSRLYWATGDIGFSNQVQWFKDICQPNLGKWKALLEEYIAVSENLSQADQQRFEAMFGVQVKIHYTGCLGMIALCEAYQLYAENKLAEAYVAANDAMYHYNQGWQEVLKSEHDHWIGFYNNDCLTNLKLTVECCDTLRRHLRMVGDGPSYHSWERKYLYDAGDQKIVLLTNTENHLDDDVLYKRLKAYFS